MAASDCLDVVAVEARRFAMRILRCAGKSVGYQ